MRKNVIAVVLMGWIFFGGGPALRAQHEHSQPENSPAATPPSEEMEHIFCPTMKTGQICSHGTAATLGLQGTEAEAWISLARKYNRAVDAATMQLFQDTETVLSTEQLTQLKAWFAVGLNPQINELLYDKGLGQPMSPAADSTSEAADAMPAGAKDEK